MKHHPIRELPIDQIEPDPESPDPGFGTPEEERQLQESIKEFGVLSPLLVSHQGQDRCFILDGVRRFRAARALAVRTLLCVVFPSMTGAEREAVCFRLERTRKPLTQAELARQRRRLRGLGIEPPGAAS